MRRLGTLSIALLVALGAAGSSTAQDSTLAVTNALLYPVSSSPIEDGVLIVRDGTIVALGAGLAVPEGARILDVEGRVVMPGLVETHSHMAFKQLNIPATGRDNNELSTPINAEVRAIDGLNSRDAAFSLALAAGVTTMNVTPGSRSPNSGQAVVIKLRGGTIEDMYLAHGGMKFAIRADRQFENFPSSVDEVKELLASRLRAAREYLAERERAAASGTKPPLRDLELEAFGKLLTREWVVGVHAHSADHMSHAIALKKEFDLDLYIHHGNGTLELAEELAAESIPVSFGPVLPFKGRENPELAGPVRLVELGGRVAFHQDHPDGHQYFLRHGASLFVRKGMPRDEALKALTLYPASIFHLDDRIGSLEPGKDADFLVLSGPPLDFESLVEKAFIDGVEVYDRASGKNVFGERVPEGW